MAGKDRVESASTIADWILLALLMMTKTVTSFCHISETFRKHLIFPAYTHLLILACFPIHTNGKVFCKEKQCIKVDIKAVIKLYTNLLVPIEDLRKLQDNQEKYRRQNVTYVKNNLNSDLDMCCPTLSYFSTQNTMTNINGIERTIVRTEDLNQLIPVGKCLTGNCHKCVPRYRTMSILVVDFNRNYNPPVEFDQFQVPLYCICLSRFRF